jgi:long-chain acyl-CoA synthetase
MGIDNLADHWGSDVVRREGDPAFLIYARRRHQVSYLLDDSIRWADRTHIVQGDRRSTVRDVQAAVGAVARRLIELGVQPGDRVALLSPNSPEWVVTFWAVLRIGAIATAWNGWWSEDEVGRAYTEVEPTLILVDDKRAAFLPAVGAAAALHVEAVRAVIDGSAGSTLPEPVARDEGEDAAAVIIYTAGTTGFPKPVVLSHRALLANLQNLLVTSGRLPGSERKVFDAGVSLQTGPLFHMGGVQGILLAMVNGNTMVFLEGRYRSDIVLDIIERERVSWWGAIPTMVSRLLDDPSLSGRDLSCVRAISMGGAPIAPALLERVREAFPSAKRGLSTIYGMTETGGTVASASGALMVEHPDTSGRPVPVAEIKIDTAVEGGRGEVLVRTPGQMTGYWGRASNDVIDDEGFVHTGDEGRLADGLLYITGRVKDIIIRGGENIAPAHVEGRLLEHPEVAAVAVFGVPDEDLGEVVASVVQVRSGAGVSADDLRDFLSGRIAAYSVPSVWRIGEDELPLTEAGKVNKKVLSATFREAEVTS